jgi:hypothetical protein
MTEKRDSHADEYNGQNQLFYHGTVLLKTNFCFVKNITEVHVHFQVHKFWSSNDPPNLYRGEY